MTVTLVYVTTVPMTLEFLLRGQIGHMKDRGFEVVAVASPGPSLDRIAAREGITVHPVPMERGIAPFSDICALVRLWRLFRALKPTIVHASTGKAGPLGILAARLAQVPVSVYGLRGLMIDRKSGPAGSVLRTLEWLTCRTADRVIAVSRSIVDLMVREGLCPAEKVTVPAQGSSNGVDGQHRFNPRRLDYADRDIFRARFGIPKDALVIGFVGRLVAGKGIRELADAWTALRGRHPSAWLFLAGTPEAQDPVPPVALDLLRKDGRVIMADAIDNDEMPLFYAAVDVICLPTYSEGLPNVVLEAGAMELPVVATAVTGCIDSVIDGATGTLVPPRDAAALERALSAYLEDAGLRIRHGTAAREFVLRTFPQAPLWEAIADEYARLLEKRMPALRPSLPTQREE